MGNIVFTKHSGRNNQIIKTTDNKNKVRIDFFSDIHITNIEEEVQTDFGAPNSEIPTEAKRVLNSLNAEYIWTRIFNSSQPACRKDKIDDNSRK